jgi:protein TonB
MFHGALLLLLILVWKNIPSVKKVNFESKLSVELRHVICEEAVTKPTPQKPKVKPKPLVKKAEVVKEEPIVIPEEEEVEIVEDVAEVINEVVETLEEPVTDVKVASIQDIVEEVVEEDANAKQRRLEQDYLQEHLSRISKLLQENLYYPRRARKRGIVGEVVVTFILTREGIAKFIEVQSSKSEILSRAAIKTIENLSGYFPKPTEELILHVPIAYRLK